MIAVPLSYDLDSDTRGLVSEFIWLKYSLDLRTNFFRKLVRLDLMSYLSSIPTPVQWIGMNFAGHIGSPRKSTGCRRGI